MEFFSQNGQDEFLAKLFKNKKNGFFLDVGAYDGLWLSNTWFFERNLGWKGICIEPNPSVFEKLKINRNCTSINCCISEKEGRLNFLSVLGYGEMLSGLVDFFDDRHVDRIDKIIDEHGGSKLIIEVTALPIQTILKDHTVSEIDYCNIDVEGGEMSVLKSIDFSKVKISVFTIENNNGTKNVRKFLRPLGYSLIYKIGADEVYELNSLHYDLMIHWRIKRVKNYIYLKMKRLLRIFKSK